MTDDAGLAEAARQFRAKISGLDQKRAETFREDIERGVDWAFEQFCFEADLPLKCSVRFANVFAMLGLRTHVQLACVEWRGDECRFIFSDLLLDGRDPNGLVFVAKTWVLLMIMGKLRNTRSLPDCDFVFEIGDNAYLDSVAFCSKNAGGCLILDDEFAGTLGYSGFRSFCASNPLSWNERVDKVVWRGSTTGLRAHCPPALAETDDLSWLPRLKMARRAADPLIAARCDVGVTAVVQIDEPDLVDRIKGSGLVRTPIPREEMRRFRFILDIDGNSNAWSGLFCALLGGGCVLKVGSQDGYRQWYYDALRPMESFVPIQPDLSDFIDVVLSTTQSGRDYAAIAAAGRSIAERMTFENAVDASTRNIGRWLDNRVGKGLTAGAFLPAT